MKNSIIMTASRATEECFIWNVIFTTPCRSQSTWYVIFGDERMVYCQIHCFMTASVDMIRYFWWWAYGLLPNTLFYDCLPGTGEFPALMASNAKNVSIWWRHHADHHITHSLLSECENRQYERTGDQCRWMRAPEQIWLLPSKMQYLLRVM